MVRAVLRAMASLWLTVALLTLAMALIFIGTLAQVRVGVWEAVHTYFRAPIAWVDPNLFIPASAATLPFRVPLPGGATIGALLLLNLLAAHAARFKLTARRAGIITLHAGLIALLIGEFATALLADEGMMSIDEGRTVSYVEDVRSTELAIIDSSDPTFDRVLTVPQSLLIRAATRAEPIADPRLPFDIHVESWLPNARLLKAADEHIADRGIGLEAAAEPLPTARGVDGAQTDAPAAYVRLIRDGDTIGTWLVWANLVAPQPIDTGDSSYALALRYKRTHKPYTLTLLDFQHDTFVGTEVARNF